VRAEPGGASRSVNGAGAGDPEAGGRPRGGPFDRRLVREAPAVRWTVAGSVAVGLLSTATVVVQALALAELIASAMPGARPSDRVAAFVWLGIAVAVRGLTALAGEILAHVGASLVKADLRSRLLSAALAGAPASTAGGPGDVATLAGRGLDALDVYIGRCLPDLVLGAVAPIATVVAIGWLDWLSGVIVLVVVALFPIFGALVGRASMSLAGSRWRQVEALGRHITDVFEGLVVLRAFGRGAEQRARIARAGEALRRASLSTLRTAFLSALVLDTLASVSVALVAVPLGLRLLDGSVRLSSALAVLIIAPEVFVPLRRASAEFHESTEGLSAVGRVMAMIDRDRDRAAERPPSSGGLPLPVPDPRSNPVALRSVRVEVPGREQPTIDDASLVIAPGETVVLVGPSGAGKSTVVSLLLGFVSPSRGSVTVGDTDLRDVDLAEWRRHVTYLPEHPTILVGTLADNLRLVNPSATDAALRHALAQAGASELIENLPAGMATRLGDGGRPISAGELQRIALARVLLRPASLYVLDEPTVHLDEETEAATLDGLRGALDGNSALIVTHRPATVALADRVLALDNGRLVPVLRSPSAAVPA
jgi:ATP-binding cassette subfamily C protein CydD